MGLKIFHYPVYEIFDNWQRATRDLITNMMTNIWDLNVNNFQKLQQININREHCLLYLVLLMKQEYNIYS